MLRQRQDMLRQRDVTNVGFILGQCLRRWPNIKTSLGQRLVFIRCILLNSRLQCLMLHGIRYMLHVRYFGSSL